MATMIRRFRTIALGAAACLLTISTSMSDDLDVYVAPPSGATVGQTLVVFTLDIRPDVMASTVCTGGECDSLFKEVGMFKDEDGDGEHDDKISFFEMLVAALKKVLFAIDNNKVKVALMIPHDDTTGGNKECVGFRGKNVTPDCSNGAYVLSAFKGTGNDDELIEFFTKMESIPLKDGGNWSHDYQLKELFFEMFRYVSGGDVYNNENGLDNFLQGSDKCGFNITHAGDTESVLDSSIKLSGDTEPVDLTHDEIFPEGVDCPAEDDITNSVAELEWDKAAVKPEEKRYIETLADAEHCTDVFSVNVTDAKAAKDHDSDADIAADPPAGFGFDPDDNEKGRAQVLEYLSGTDLADHLVGKQNIRSYFITTPGRASTANAWAKAGGTGSALIVEDDPDELVRLLSGLFNEIEGVSTTFIAASVPANVFNRAETLDEVFIAIFEPNEDSHPFWVGNVKKLARRTIEETVEIITHEDGTEEVITEEASILVDAQEADAINPNDGRIRADALTFWTRTGTDDAYLPPPDPDSDEHLEFSEGTDGRKVDRGGAGQVKPGYLPVGEPGDENPDGETDLSGPRKIFTEADDDSIENGLWDLDADSSDVTAIELLSDPRTYPGSDDTSTPDVDESLTYGDFLFQTVMSCDACDYEGASDTDKSTARQRVNNLIRYARGQDFTDIDTATGDKRPWWQADPLHSRPLALNYGAQDGFTEERPDIRIVIGGNDGMVQMIRDGRRSDGSEDGVEAWGFLPREFVPLQKRLLDGDPGLYVPGQPINDDEEPRAPLHPYAMDGAPTALVIDNNLDGTINPDQPSTEGSSDGDDRVYLFFGQRRGGKRYYALDVSDPDNPEFLWSIGKDDDGDDFAEMAQSWSVIRPAIMEVDEGGVIKKRPVAIFSGGYNGDDGGDGVDLGKDQRVGPGPDGIFGPDADGVTDDVRIVGTDDHEGNALFIVNALTGELIWKAVGPPNGHSTETTLNNDNLVDSVAAAPSLVDADGDGLVDRVYFADTGGTVWRMDAAVPDRANWTVTRLFEGGRHFQNDIANDRRFFHAPDIVFAGDDDGEFDAVILTSGDRPHPLGTDVENWAYMIKDRNTTSGSPRSSPLNHDDLADLTDNCLQNDADVFTDCSDDLADTNIHNGWKVQLEQCDAGDDGETDPNCGEKGLSSPLTIEGTIFFTTFLPVVGSSSDSTPTTCSPAEGSGLLYGLDLQTAGGVLDFNPDNDTDGAETPDRFDRLASPGIPPNPVAISPEELLRPDLAIEEIPGRPSAKTFWYERRFD